MSRTLLTVHQAIDLAFPEADPAPQRFAKTVFGEDENTVPHGKKASEWDMDEDTAAIAPKPEMEREEKFGPDEATLHSMNQEQSRWKQSLVAAGTIIIITLIAYLLFQS